MNVTVDLFIIGIIVLSVVIGFVRGFLREAISLITWFLALVAALKFSPVVSEMMKPVIINHTMRYVAAVFLLVIIVFVLGTIVSKLVHAVVVTSGMGFFDRVLGLFFGAARGILFVSILLLIAHVSPYQNSKWLKESKLAVYFTPIVNQFNTLLPKDIRAASSWMAHFSALHQKITVVA